MPPTSLPRRAFFVLMLLLSLLVGVASLRYALPGQPFASDLSNLLNQRALLVIHAVSAALVLMIGPLQFMGKLRARKPQWHRFVGWSYALGTVASWLVSLPLAWHAQTGQVAAFGFLALGLAWVWATVQGVRYALKRRFEQHRRWMIRSFALTAAAITLRLYLGAALALDVPFALAYPAIAWLCWVPNALLAEAYLRWEWRDPQAQLRMALS